MSLWVIIPVVAYFLVVAGFLIAIYMEAGKRAAEVGILHYLVVLFWPGWCVWYGWVLFSDWLERRKKRK